MSKGDESKKYFNIQVESKKTIGTPILIDSNKSPEECLKDLTSSYSIKYVDGEDPHYLFFEKSASASSKESLLKAIINKEGNLKIIESKKNIFNTPINKNQAYELAKSSKN